MEGATRVQLFGEFCIVRESKSESPSLVSSQKLIALLCQRPDYAWPRAEIGRLFWPESDDDSNRNKIRTALVQARSAVGDDVISGDKLTVSLISNSISTDLWEARSLLKRAAGSAEELDEEQALKRLLEMIRLPYLPAFQDPWVENERRRWRDRAFDIRLRLGTLAESREDWRSANDYYETSLLENPYDERIWAALLRVYARQGRHIEICERFSGARTRLRKDLGGKFTSTLINLSDSVRSGSQPPPQILPSQGDMASRTFGRMIVEAPDQALQFLSTELFRGEVYKSPKLVCDLLMRLLDATKGVSQERLQCAAYAISAQSLLNNQAEVRKLAPFILENDSNLARKRGASNAIAFAYFQIRDWDKAFAYGELSHSLAMEAGNKIGVLLARAQIAAFKFHKGQFEEALATYDYCLKELQAFKEHHALTGRGVILVNKGFIYAMQGEQELANAAFKSGINLSEITANSAILALAFPAQGAMDVLLGFAEKGCETVSRGLSMAYRSKDDRSLEIGLDFAALALAKMGHHGESLATVEHVGKLREKSHHPRSFGEELVVAQIQKLCGNASPNREWLILPSRRHLLGAILDTLS